MCIQTPLTKVESVDICKRIGIKGLNTIADIMEYKYIAKEPSMTFKLRLETKLKEDGWI